jgi:endoglucanase
MFAHSALSDWRGFNLTQMISVKSNVGFDEDDFRMIADLGFNFVRLPLCYLLWLKNRTDDDSFQLEVQTFDRIDQAVEWGRRYGLHVCLNFHRAPGYSVNEELKEKRFLWKSAGARESFCRHWSFFAERYKGVPAKQLSFNLINEPPTAKDSSDPQAWVMTREDHKKVVVSAVQAIHAKDPERLVITDGVDYGNDPCPELANVNVAQSCRAYLPFGISHYRASWFLGSDQWREPLWPGALRNGGDGKPWGRPELEAHFRNWADLTKRGIGVHCGEGGAWKFTPHEVVLRWWGDVLEILKAHKIGWALWEFRGGFGILDSGRSDVAYEDWHGHKLDRRLLTLLQAH